MVQEAIRQKKQKSSSLRLGEVKFQGKSLKNSLNLLIGIGIGSLLTWGGFVLLTPKPETQQPAETETIAAPNPVSKTVTTALVEKTSIESSLEATGTVNAFELIPVSSQATGLQIVTILADTGQWVKTGQPLAKLDDSVLQAQIAEERAKITRAEARLKELEVGSRPEIIAQAAAMVRSAEADVLKAESDLALARKRVERNEDLEAAGAIAQDYLDEILNHARSKESDLEQARAKLEESREKLAEVERGPREEEILQAKAELAQAKAQLSLVEARLAQTNINAPVNGIIAERNARIGEITEGNNELFNIIENGRLELELRIPETLIPEITPGQKVRITTQGKTHEGQVREIKPLIDADSRQAIVEVDLPSGTNLKPGMFLSATIITKTRQAMTIPVESVLPEAGGRDKVYVVQEGKAELREIELGEILPGDRVEVKSNLQPQEKVVVKGAAYLNPGDEVVVKANEVGEN